MITSIKKSLQIKVTLCVLILALLGLAYLAYIFNQLEDKMVHQFEDEQVSFVEHFVTKTLQPVMLSGSATIMPSLLESYRNFSSLDEIKILRINGKEAFTDQSTIQDVNTRLGSKKFTRATIADNYSLSEDNPLLIQAISTGKKIVSKSTLDNGKQQIQMIIPFLNKPQCQVCHGSDHKVRGVMFSSFSSNQISDSRQGNINDFMQYSALVLVLLVLGLFAFFQNIVVGPLTSIVKQVRKLVAKDHYHRRFEIKSQDEIGTLAEVFNNFIAEAEEYRTEQLLEKERLEVAVKEKTRELQQKNDFIEQDMEIAAKVQEKLLPETLPQIPNIEFSASYIPCLSIGGDFYDVFEIDDEYIGLFMSDAAGHGSSAALIVSIVKTLLQSHDDIIYPAKLVKHLNDFMALNTPAFSYVTLFYGLLNKNTGVMCYTLAGHPSPVIISTQKGRAIKLESTGGLVGSFDFNEFEQQEIALEKGDRLFIYTDGLSEAQDLHKQQFGIDNILALLTRDDYLNATDILTSIKQSLNQHTNNDTLKDDIAMLVVDFERTPCDKYLSCEEQSLKLLKKIKCKACSTELCNIRQQLRECCNEMKFSQSDMDAITLAIDEACANVIRHAYKDTEQGEITVYIYIGEREAIFIISDFGKTADDKCFKLQPQNLLNPGGLGLPLIYNIMDSVRLLEANEKHCNRLELRKKLPKEFS